MRSVCAFALLVTVALLNTGCTPEGKGTGTGTKKNNDATELSIQKVVDQHKNNPALVNIEYGDGKLFYIDIVNYEIQTEATAEFEDGTAAIKVKTTQKIDHNNIWVVLGVDMKDQKNKELFAKKTGSLLQQRMFVLGVKVRTVQGRFLVMAAAYPK